MLSNKNFYPTPLPLATKMVGKIKKRPSKVLEPSAGKGDLIESLEQRWKHSHGGSLDISAIEIDPTLQATLRGKNIRLIDTDFLSYAGADQFDLIIANPPFDAGDKHLLKALDIMYRGQIIFLLNAETLRNPHTNERKLLVRRLDEAGAEIEYIQNAFVNAERRTGVEVALVSVVVDRKVEDDLFADCDDHATRCYETVQEKHEVSTGRSIEELVLDYNETVRICTETILGYFRNSRKVGKYMGLTVGDKEDSQSFHGKETLTERMQVAVNRMLRSVRTDFWRSTLELKDFREKLTVAKRRQFEDALTVNCYMDFTEANIRQFMLNLIGSYEQTLTEAVLDLFDMFTVRHCWDGENLHEKNIHFSDGWKTNKAFKVGKRVVVPVRASYGSAFCDSWNGQWSLNYGAAAFLDDIDKVMSYFDGGGSYTKMSTALAAAFAVGESTATGTYFKIIAHKKGTAHLTFLNDDVLRRFNVVACRGKGWLPGDFGARSYKELSAPERDVVDAFEGAKSYDANRQAPLFAIASSLPQIGMLGDTTTSSNYYQMLS